MREMNAEPEPGTTAGSLRAISLLQDKSPADIASNSSPVLIVIFFILRDFDDDLIFGEPAFVSVVIRVFRTDPGQLRNIVQVFRIVPGFATVYAVAMVRGIHKSARQLEIGIDLVAGNGIGIGIVISAHIRP